jgi:hypothetical protein
MGGYELSTDKCFFEPDMTKSRAERRRELKEKYSKEPKLNVSPYSFSRKDRRHRAHAIQGGFDVL